MTLSYIVLIFNDSSVDCHEKNKCHFLCISYYIHCIHTSSSDWYMCVCVGIHRFVQFLNMPRYLSGFWRYLWMHGEATICSVSMSHRFARRCLKKFLRWRLIHLSFFSVIECPFVIVIVSLCKDFWLTLYCPCRYSI